jgi:tripartite-type tricarboxylate transporter receptor subunit TctC
MVLVSVRALALGTITAALLVTGALADGTVLSDKPIEVVTHSGVGGGTDITARMMMVQAPGELKTELVVQNKTGGSGAAALSYANSRPRDGHTILLVTQTHLLTLLRNKNTGVTFEDLVPLARATDDPQVLMVGKGSSYKTAQDLLEDAKTKALKFGATGIGSGDHITTYTFAKAAGITQPKIVPFRSGGDITTNLVSGNLDGSLQNYTEAESQIKAGDIRPLLVLADERLPIAPDVPTAKEIGLDLNLSTIRGFVLLQGTPEDRVALLRTGLLGAMQGKVYQDYLKGSGAAPNSVTGADVWGKQLAESYEQSQVALRELGLTQ